MEEWRTPRETWFEQRENEARKASLASRLLLLTTQARLQSLKMPSTSDNSSDSNGIPLTENDIPGASLLGRKPEELKNSELKFWLKCRGDTEKGLKTKAELVKRVYEFIRSGKDKQITDPDPP